MGSRRKKRLKKETPSESVREMRRIWDLPEEEQRRALFERRMVRQRAYESKVVRQFPYKQRPKARGVHHRRHCHWGGPSNGTLCMRCLRRAGTHLVRTYEHERRDGTKYKTHDYACNRCGSESLVFIPSIPRLPRRTASKSAWKKFLKREVPTWLQVAGGIPDDFMEGV